MTLESRAVSELLQLAFDLKAQLCDALGRRGGTQLETPHKPGAAKHPTFIQCELVPALGTVRMMACLKPGCRVTAEKEFLFLLISLCHQLD